MAKEKITRPQLDDTPLPKKAIVSVSSNVMDAGKSTFKEIFMQTARERHASIAEASFAAPLKRTVATLLSEASGKDVNVIYSKMADPKFKAARAEPKEVFGGKTVRQLLQMMGTEFGRGMIDKHLWEKLLLNKVRNELKDNLIVIVDDTRFANEYFGLTKLAQKEDCHFIDVFIDRDIPQQGIHASEGELDFLREESIGIIFNHGTLEEFKQKCKDTSEELIRYILKEEERKLEPDFEEHWKYINSDPYEIGFER